MEYVEFKAEITPLEIGRDILIAELAEIGFESFVENQTGVEAYIQKAEYNEALIKISLPTLYIRKASPKGEAFFVLFLVIWHSLQNANCRFLAQTTLNIEITYSEVLR